MADIQVDLTPDEENAIDLGIEECLKVKEQMKAGTISKEDSRSSIVHTTKKVEAVFKQSGCTDNEVFQKMIYFTMKLLQIQQELENATKEA